MTTSKFTRARLITFEYAFWGPGEWSEEDIQSWKEDFWLSPQMSRIRQLLLDMENEEVIGWDETDWQGHSVVRPPDWTKKKPEKRHTVACTVAKHHYQIMPDECICAEEVPAGQ